MAGETQITIVGNLVEDPDLRFTPSGAAVANFRVASSSRIFDKQAQEWRDGDTLFLRCAVWRQYAENLAESSLGKGQRVIVQGRLKQREWETKEGEKRTSYEIDVDEVGPALRFAKAQVTKANPSNGGGGQSQGYGQTGGRQAPASDPWDQGGFAGGDEPPPF